MKMEIEMKVADGIEIGDGGGVRNDRWYRDSSWGWRQKWQMVKKLVLGVEMEDDVEIGDEDGTKIGRWYGDQRLKWI